MSFSVAFASGVTIVKFWLRYRREAPNSPSAPPYCSIMIFASLASGFVIFTGNSNFFS